MPVDERHAAWEARIHAFVADAAGALGAEPAKPGAGPLAGVAFAVKDIIDVAGVPTRNGSRACADAPPAARDADVVQALRDAGGVFVGKTKTTEFAVTDPTDCRNPHDLGRSPGGSSSGSGAAVGAGLADIALGTQTAGSLCRPAAYCGVVGFKPGFGVLSTRGVTPLAPSFDAVGVIARSVDLARRSFAAMAGRASAERDEGDGDGDGGGGGADLHAAAALLEMDVVAHPDALAAFEDAADRLAGMTAVKRDVALPVAARDVIADHRKVMFHEAHVAHGHLLTGGRADDLRPNFRAGLRDGLAISPDEAAAAKARLAAAKARFWDEMAEVDVTLTLPVPEGAPLIGETTGFQHWLTPWTVFGGPLICLPWGLDRLGRPLSVMLAGRPGAEGRLLDLAARLEAVAPPTPAPVLPDA